MNIKLNWICSSARCWVWWAPLCLMGFSFHALHCFSAFVPSLILPPPHDTLSHLTLRIKNAFYICFYHPKNSGKSCIPLLFLLPHLLLTQPTPQFILICIFTYTPPPSPPPPPKLTHVHFAVKSSQHILSLKLAVTSAHNFLFTHLGIWETTELGSLSLQPLLSTLS